MSASDQIEHRDKSYNIKVRERFKNHEKGRKYGNIDLETVRLLDVLSLVKAVHAPAPAWLADIQPYRGNDNSMTL
jgi:hypothetical protein